jgi:hypothetical protein
MQKMPIGHLCRTQAAALDPVISRRTVLPITRIQNDTKSREEIMRKPAAVFTIALALGATILAPRAGAQAQDARGEEGPIDIEKCQTISQPGSYKLVKNLTFTSSSGTCLTITANFVTIDLAGFAISRPSG